MSLTVGELRAILAELAADLEVAIPGGEYDFQNAGVAHVVSGIEWIEDPDEPTDDEPSPRTMLVIEP